MNRARLLGAGVLFSAALFLFGSVTHAQLGLLGVGNAGVASITCSGTCWAAATCSSSSSCATTSTTQTINVPGGSSGVIQFDGGYTHTVQYSKNGGTFTTIANNGTVTFTNGQTLAIKITGLGCDSDSDTVTVTDNATGATVGTFTGTNTRPCL
jgi:hypothetical protein